MGFLYGIQRGRLARIRDVEAPQPRKTVPISVLAWDGYSAEANDTVVVDTLGFSDLTIFTDVSGAADITLDAVSRDNVNFRTVDETVHSYSAAGSAIDDLNNVLTKKSALKYRYLRFKISAAVTVTLEVTGKHLGRSQILSADEIGLAKTGQLPSSLTNAGNLKQSIEEPLTDAGNIKLSLEEQSIAAGADLQARYAKLIELHASGSETADGNSGDIDVSQILYVKAVVDVTDVSGTNPTLDIYLEGKDELSGKYETLWNPAQFTGTGTAFSGVLTIPHQNVRLRWVVGGTNPSFTFSSGANCKV